MEKCNMSKPFRGVYTIPSTPLTPDLEIDWDGLRRVVDFCVECGTHGIVWPVNASGFATLSDEERLQGMQVVTEQTAGRIPVVLGTQGVSASHAAMFSRHADAVGADAVIAMAPYIQALTEEDAIIAYFQAISDAIDIPIFVQNHARGSVLSVGTLIRLLDEVEYVEYIKEETFPVTHIITQVIEQSGPKLKGIFGGSGGRFLLLEHPRGVDGQMPGCHITDVVVRLWNALEAGDREEAKRVFGKMGPIFALETLRGSNYAEVLRRRGVIDFAGSRSGGASLIDDYDQMALDEILRDLEPLFTWNEGGPLRYSGIAPSAEGSTSTPMGSGSDSDVDTFDQQ
jgi:dihydrodipicolinate synthase/N-acetylneuraminate lyase